ncbi:MAG: PatB family C-S lyase [Bacteroidales bacterium]|jgi:cystathionine beta-lyase|nr:PatB family C-S lyase [Bacteroidales bacterium]
MEYNFDKLIERASTASVKYDLRQFIFKNPDVLPMWVADMDFETPDFIRQAVIKRAQHPIYGYTFRPESYYQAIMNWFLKRHNWKVEKDWILFSPGVVPAVNFAVLALTNPGDEIIVQPPVYFPFFSAVQENNRQIVYNQLIRDGDQYQINFDQLEKQAQKARMLILCNPHNPVGRSWTKEELTELGKICLKHNLLVISDEIHADLVLPGHKHQVFAEVFPELSANIITMHAASKTFNLAGLASSSVIISDLALREQYKSFISRLHIDMGNLFGMVATQTAFEKGEQWLGQVLDYIVDNIVYATDFLADQLPKVKVIKPEATYMIWLDFSAFQMSDDELKSFLINEAKLGLNSGIDFGPGGEGFMRINVACPRLLLQQGLERLRDAFTQLFQRNNV